VLAGNADDGGHSGAVRGVGATSGSRGTVAAHAGPAGAHVITLTGEFDLSNTAEFATAAAEALETGARRLVIDLKHVSFIDSTMLAALVAARADSAERGAGFAVVRPNPTIWRLFQITRLDHRIPNHTTLERALNERPEPT